MNKNFICLIFILSVSNIYASPSSLINRNILQVGRSDYTQRDLEIYILTKNVITGGEDMLISERNWSKYLGVFQNDMLFYTVVNDESQFYGSFQPKLEYINERVAALKKRMKSYKAISAYIEKQGWTDRDFEKVIVQLEILKLYLTRKNIVRENDFDFKKIETYLNAQWFKDAISVKVYRMYEGAQKYVELREVLF